MDTLARLAADPEIRRGQLEAMRKAKATRAEAWRLKKSGLTFAQVGEKLGVSRQRAQFLVHRYHTIDKPKKNGGRMAQP